MHIKYWQIIWEIIAFTISGVLLILYIIQPSYKHLSELLVLEYLIAIINTVGWWKWVNKADSQNKINK